MAELFRKQTKEYAETRPTYPPDLFRFLSSKTPRHLLAWDVATGSGQAAISLAAIYDSVVATDASREQLALAPSLPNVRYVHTPPDLSPSNLHSLVAPPASVDLVTVAQALHWLPLPSFYAQARAVLRPDSGVVAAWCYTEPRVDPAVDAAFLRLYSASGPYWAPARLVVDGEYRGVEFPFEPVEGEEGTGPFEFAAERSMALGEFLTYVRSWSAYQTARVRGVELLPEARVAEFREAWGGDEAAVKAVRFPIFLRIGRVGSTR